MADPAVKEAGWTRVAFGDVVRKVADRVNPEESGLDRYVAGEHMDTDDLRIRRWGTVGDGYLGPAFHMRFRPGQVLYGSRRTYLRKVAVADFEGITANTTFVLEPKDPNVLLPDLLPFIMQAEPFHDHSIEQSRGSVNPYVNFSDLDWYEFALPPVDEQRRIIELLWAAEVAVQQLIRLKEAHETCAESAIVRAFGELDAPSLAIGDVATRVTNGFVGSAVQHYVDDGVPYLRSLNVRRSGLDLEDLVFVSEAFHEATKKSQLEMGDLLTVQSGHVGETAVVPPECAGWNCHALILTRLKLGSAEPEYLSLYLNSVVGRRQLASYYVGSTVAHLNTSDLEALRVPLPALQDQVRMAHFGTALREPARSLELRLNSADRVRRALIASVLPEGGNE